MKYNLINLLYSWVLASLHFEVYLAQMGYRPPDHDLSAFERFRVGFDFTITLTISYIIGAKIVWKLKKLFGRVRPYSPRHILRIKDLRPLEGHSYAMPSGDAMAGAIFCYFHCVAMSMP